MQYHNSTELLLFSVFFSVKIRACVTQLTFERMRDVLQHSSESASSSSSSSSSSSDSSSELDSMSSSTSSMVGKCCHSLNSILIFFLRFRSVSTFNCRRRRVNRRRKSVVDDDDACDRATPSFRTQTTRRPTTSHRNSNSAKRRALPSVAVPHAPRAQASSLVRKYERKSLALDSCLV